jgi:hypothetical protein
MAQFNVGLQKVVKQASLVLEIERAKKLECYAGRTAQTMNDVLRSIVCPAIDALEIPEATEFNQRPTRKQRSL